MIVIHPFSRPMPSGEQNPKNYPYWKELIQLIAEPIVQIGIDGEEQLVDDFRKNLTIEELKGLIKECRTWISIDSFFQHLCWSQKKPGIVLWSITDPVIFGHPENINLLKDRSYLADNQFIWMIGQKFNAEAFVSPQEVLQNL